MKQNSLLDKPLLVAFTNTYSNNAHMYRKVRHITDCSFSVHTLLPRRAREDKRVHLTGQEGQEKIRGFI